MAEGPFDHLEITGDEGKLPEELKPALRNCMCKRIEFGPAPTATGKIMALRTDGGKLYYADDEKLPPWFDDLLHFVGERGLTTAFTELARSMGTAVVLVESLPSKSPEAGPPPKAFDVEGWTPEKGKPDQEQLDSIPTTQFQKIARVVAAILGVLLYCAWHYYYYKIPEGTRLKLERGQRREQESQERHDDALKKTLRNY